MTEEWDNCTYSPICPYCHGWPCRCGGTSYVSERVFEGNRPLSQAEARRVRKLYEDGLSGSGVPVNNMGGGKIAGAGIGPQGEPGVNPQRKRKRILTDILKRTFPQTG